MIPQIPLKYCNQSIVLRKIKGKDEWQNKEFESDIVINNMIFQQETIYSGSNNSREVVANAIAFLFADVSSPFPLISKNHVGSEIEFEGNIFTVTRVVDNRNPFSNEIYSYELEVM